MEFDLLKAFAENPNRVLSRDRLLDLAHNRDWEPFDRSIDVRVTRIRKKIEEDPAKPQVLKTVARRRLHLRADGGIAGRAPWPARAGGYLLAGARPATAARRPPRSPPLRRMTMSH